MIGDNYRNANNSGSRTSSNRDSSNSGFDDETDDNKPTYNDSGVKSGGSISSS